MLNYTHIPAWLENNFIFRKIFLFRKLYLSKVKRPHFSQFGEDISINRIFPKPMSGFFVDVGCYHPKQHNNTWQLYKKGWNGINIDIDSIKIEGFSALRPKDTNINCAVSNMNGEVSYYTNGFYSLVNSLDSDYVKGKKNYIKKSVKCYKLTNIIDDSKYKNREIDFLSVDAEGHDLDVLRSLDFDTYNPKLIAVEAYQATLSEVQKTELYQFLIQKDYCLVGWCGLSLLMANRDLQLSLNEERKNM